MQALDIIQALRGQRRELNIVLLNRNEFNFIKIDAVLRTHHFVIRANKELMEFLILTVFDKFFIGLLSASDLLHLNHLEFLSKFVKDHIVQHIIV